VLSAKLYVDGILAFAESVLPRAADLWAHASLEQRQRFQQLFFSDGIAFDGNRQETPKRQRLTASSPREETSRFHSSSMQRQADERT
jgi:hypothetical protein